MRLLTGILVGQPFDATLVGDASLMQRPMERIAAPLRQMGADVRTHDGRAPISIRGGRRMAGCEHVLDVPSAQVKSALLFAGLYAEGCTRVREPAVSRDHTERMLESFGVPVIREAGAAAVAAPAGLRARRVSVPGDFSSAAYFLAAALVAGSGPFTVRGVGVNPTRTALLDILRLMGAEIRVHATGAAAAEPVADIEVCPGRLRGIVVPAPLVPAAIDELPLLFAIAALSEGETVVTNAAELRVKESDRIAAMAAGLAALGIRVEVQPDGMRVLGGTVRGGTVDSRGDHRVAMAFTVLAAKAESAVTIVDVQNVGTSFPGFARAARAAGLRLLEEP
jgi:3-phosphoshikimate 1-carboxyvinyltransferase